VKTIKSVKPTQGFSDVVLPGEIENRTIRERLQAGIPIDENTWRELEGIAKELDVRPPPKPNTS
jgi:LDH2 family malate/lactate/ureidoglycolate dehydrogenase